jgi:hypothetical protein
MKKWYRSKTLWINAIAITGIVLQSVTGQEIISTELQGIILGLINAGLRIVTNEGLE